MAISRRFFIKSGTLTALAAGVALSPHVRALGQRQSQGTSQGFQIPITAQKQPSYMFTRATFDPYVGSIFQAPNARGKMISLTLLSAISYKTSATTKLTPSKARETESFSLIFRAAAPLPEFTSIHQVSHPALGKFDLFLTPYSQAGQELTYEAVFNHV